MAVRNTSIFAASSLLFGLFAAACGPGSNTPDSSGTSSAAGTGTSTSTGANTTSGSAGTGGGGFDPGGPSSTIEAAMGPISVLPGKENTQCVVVSLKNAEGAYVRRFRADLGEGSHHMIAYVANATQEDTTPKDCDSFAGVLQGEHPIFIAQQAHSDLVFPTDVDGTPVGFEIKPNQMVRIEMHYINVTTQPIDVTGKILLDTVPLSTKVTKSDLAFWGTSQINIPANGSFDTGVKFQKAIPGTSVFALTTHQHHLGKEMLVWHAKDKTDTSHQIADSTNWADPPLEIFSPALTFPGPNGEAGFAFECKWTNTTASTVSFGEGFNDEMCFLWHYYYPAQGFQFCLDFGCKTAQ